MTQKFSLYLLLTVFSFFIFTQTTKAQWTQVPNNISFDINDIYFGNDTIGILASDSGLYTTINGGTIWTRLTTGLSANDLIVYNRSKFKTAIINISAGAYYIGGRDTILNSAVIFKYINYNSTFTLLISDTSSTCINSIVDNYAVGNNGYFAKIYPYYHKINTPYSNDLYDLSNTYSGNLIVGDSIIYKFSGNYILNTYFGEKFNHIIRYFYTYKAFAIDTNHLKVLTGQNTWTPITAIDGPFVPKTLRYVYASSNNYLAYLGTESGIYRSKTPLIWEKFPNTNSYHVLCINRSFYTATNRVYAGCKNGVLLRTDNLGGSTTPYVDFSAPNGLCLNQASTFTVNGISSNTYTWSLNGTQVATGLNYSKTFTSVGSYTISVTASNGTYSSTKSKTFQVTTVPLTTYPYTISDTLICKEGSSDISFATSENNVNYKLVELTSNTVVDQQISSGGSVVLNTGFITDSTNYYIIAENSLSYCSAIYPDTISIGVEHTKADFHIGTINADIGADVTVYNNSNFFDTIHWEFYNNASINQSTSDSSVNISYQNTGQKTIRMIAISSSNCIDTTISSQLYVYAADSNYSRQWAQNITGDYLPTWAGQAYDIGESVEIDKSGNIYYSGKLFHAILPSKNGIELDTLNSNNEIFITKYDTNGTLKWAVRSYSENAVLRIEDMKFNNNDELFVNVYSSMNYASDSVEIHSNDGKIFWISSSSTHIIKMDTNGVIEWIKQLSNNGGRMTIDRNGNLYFIGQLTYTSYAFIVHKYDANLNLKWSNTIQATSNYYYRLGDIAVDYNNNVYVVGRWGSGQLTFNTTSGSAIVLPSPGSGTDAFIAKWDSLGVVKWAIKNFPNTRFDYAERIEADSAGNCYISGSVEHFPANQQAIFTSTSLPNDTVDIGGYYTCSYTTDGNLNWAVGSQYFSFKRMTPTAIKLDKDKNVYVVGNIDITSNVTFTSTDTNTITTVGVPHQLFFLKYDSLGQIQWFTTESGFESKNPTMHIEVNDMEIDRHGDMYFIGSSKRFVSPVIQTVIICTDTLTPLVRNAYIAKMCNDVFTIENIEMEIDTAYCQSESFSVPFEVYSRYKLFPGNVFRLEASDQYGMFTNPTVMGTLTSTNHIDTITATIPANLPPSSSYRFRIMTSNQIILGEETIVNVKPTPKAFRIDTTVCNGQNIVLVATDATNYNWTPGSLFADSTIQTVNISPQNNMQIFVEASNECATATDTFNIQIHNQLQLGVPSDTTVCAMDSILIYPNTAYNYYWNPMNGVSLLNNSSVLIQTNSSTAYYITATDTLTNCYQTDTFNVNINPIPTITLSQNYYDICNGDSIIINASTSVNYLWITNYNILNQNTLSPTVFPSTDTIYVIKAHNLQTLCANYDTAFFTVKPLPDVNILYNGYEMSVAPNESFYQWFRNDTLITGANTNTHIPSLITYYKVYVIGQNTCEATSTPFLYTSIDGLGKNELVFSLFPNPTKNKVNIEINAMINSPVEIRIFNSLGKQVSPIIKKEINPGKNTFQLNSIELNISPGVYYISIATLSKIGIKKLIIKK